MYELLKNIGTKKLTFYAVAIVLVTLISIMLSGGIVIIEGGKDSGGIKGAINRLDSNEDEKSIDLSSILGNIVFLRNGTYNFTFNQQEKGLSSTYQHVVSGFSIRTIDVTFKNQLDSTAVGYSELDCTFFDKKNNQSIYYGCPNQNIIGGSMELSIDGGKTIQSLDTYDPLTFYMGGLIGVNSSESNSGPPVISSGHIDKNTFITHKNGVVDKKFVTNNKLVTDLSDKSNSTFLFYNIDDGEINIFSDIGDKSPSPVDLSSHIKNKGVGYTTIPVISGKYLFVFSGINPETQQGDTDEDDNGYVDADQSVSVFSTSDGSFIKRFSVGTDMLVSSMQGNGMGGVALSGRDGGGVGRLVAFNHSRPTVEGSVMDNVVDNNFCYIGNDIYPKDANGKVFRYIPSKKSSYLIYENPTGSIAGVSCLYNNIYLAATGDDGLYDDTSYKHLLLSDKEYNPDFLRNEALFPMSDEGDIIMADIYLDAVSVRLRKDQADLSEKACVISDEKRSEVIGYFKNKGMDVENVLFDISYQCESVSGGGYDSSYEVPLH